MGQPKAKWERSSGVGWKADVGAHSLRVFLDPVRTKPIRRARIMLGEAMLWEQSLDRACDVQELMRLAESELERRLRVTADTMDGTGLVAATRTIVGIDPGSAEMSVVATVDARTGRLLSIDSLKVCGQEIVTVRCGYSSCSSPRQMNDEWCEAHERAADRVCTRDWAIVQLEFGRAVSLVEHVEYRLRTDLHGRIERRTRQLNGTFRYELVEDLPETDHLEWRVR